jgi:hypothetical protein
VLEDDRKEKVAAFDTVPSVLIEHPLGATEPAACAPDLTAAGKADANPERAADGRQPLAGIEVGAMRTLEETEVLRLTTEHVGRGGEQLKVSGPERVGIVRSRQ